MMSRNIKIISGISVWVGAHKVDIRETSFETKVDINQINIKPSSVAFHVYLPQEEEYTEVAS